MASRVLLLCCLLAATSAEVDERQAMADMEAGVEVEGRLFHSHELLLNVGGWTGVPRCSQSGDMFHFSMSGSCFVCGCFTSSFGALNPRCAPCNRCHGPAPLPEQWNIRPMPEVYPLLPECPQVDRPVPYPVPVPMPGPRVLVPVPLAIPSAPEKVYIPGPSVPYPVPIEKPVPVPYPVDRPYPVYQEPEVIPEPIPMPVPVPVPSRPVGVPVPVPVPGPTREVPVPVPGPPVPVPYPVEHYTYIKGRDRLIVVPVPYSETNVYSVSSIIYISPICRRYQPLVPFYIPGDSCNVHTCKVKYNFVYVESSVDQSCSGSSSSSIYSGSYATGLIPGPRPGGVLPWGSAILNGWKGWNSNVNGASIPFGGDFGAIISGGGGFSNLDGAGNAVFLEGHGGGWSSDLASSQGNAYTAFGELSGNAYGSGYLNLPQAGGVMSLLKSGDPEAK